MSINEAYKGKRVRTDKYDDYEERLIYTLPRRSSIDIPDGSLEIHYEFGVSSKLFDVDNAIKPFQDVLQHKYKFNDRIVMFITARKAYVKKGDEYITFRIEKYQEDTK